MISSYRLGDLVLLSLNQQEINEISRDFPNSIGASYIHQLTQNPFINKIDLITSIVLKKLEENYYLLPKDIKYSSLIHLRLGDVIAGNECHEIIKRPYSIDELKELVPNNDKLYIIGKPFFAKTSSTNYQECIQKSNEYLNDVILNFNGTYLDMGSADLDLLAGISAKTFIQGKGFFSKLIVEIRENIRNNSYNLKI